MYENVDFYAERANGHKTSARTGTVLVVSRTIRNGITPKAVATPKGDPNGVPCATWVALEYLARKCDPITQAEARAINPAMFAKMEAFDRSAEYRAMHAVTVAEGIIRGAYTVQPADPAVLARLPLKRCKEVDGPTGWVCE
jgi:hypothetical protein